MKELGLCLLLTAGVLSGVYARYQLGRRVRTLTLIRELLAFWEARLRYTATPLATLLTQAAAREQFAPLVFLQETAAALTQTAAVPEAWRQGVERGKRQNGLTREDTDLLRRAGDELGMTDLEGQLSHLSLLERQIEQQRDEAQQAAAVKGKLYLTLGGAAGAAVALLLL